MNSDMWNHESRAADNGRECYKCFGVESLYHDDDCNYDGNSLCYVVPYIILRMYAVCQRSTPRNKKRYRVRICMGKGEAALLFIVSRK
jgi:hypothetical protein